MSRVHSLPVAWRLDSRLDRSTKRGEADECLYALESLGFDVDSRPLSIGERGELQIRANRRRCAILIPPRVATRVCSGGREGSTEPLVARLPAPCDSEDESRPLTRAEERNQSPLFMRTLELNLSPRACTCACAPPPRFCSRAWRRGSSQSIEQSRRSSGAKYNLRHEFSHELSAGGGGRSSVRSKSRRVAARVKVKSLKREELALMRRREAVSFRGCTVN